MKMLDALINKNDRLAVAVHPLVGARLMEASQLANGDVRLIYATRDDEISVWRQVVEPSLEVTAA